jgi:hypothetical protein
VAKVRERLAVCKGAKEDTDMEKFNFKKMHDVEDNEQYQVKISNIFAALENLYDDVDTNVLGKILE